MIDNETIKKMLQQQSNITCFEIGTFCATICDMHRGHLSVGDMIREQLNLKELEKILPKRDPNETPTPVLEPEAVIVSVPVSSNPITVPKKIHSIVRIK
jgi:hypothetical protein